MLIDLRHLDSAHANDVVDVLCKSMEETMAEDPHPTDAVTGAMEDRSTLPVRRRLLQLYDHALAVLVSGHPYATTAKAGPFKASPSKCDQLEIQVMQAAPGSLAMADYLNIIDCLLLRHLPEDVLQDEAKKQAVKQFLVGNLRATQTTPNHPNAVISALPETIPQALALWQGDKPYARSLLEVAQANSARLVTDLRASARSKMQKIIVDAERRRIGEGTARLPAAPLTQQLADAFGELNRDWRRIAVTETATNSADGFLASMAPGLSVKWLAHPGACDYCRSLDGSIYQVVRPDAPHKDAFLQVWVGKQALNVGRAMAKRKRLDDGSMADRPAEERLLPAIPAHPHCRCIWTYAISAKVAA